MGKFPIQRSRPLTLVPVAHGEQPRRSAPADSLWRRWAGWWRYQQLQLRWDIERSVARLFRRRWGR